MFSLSKPLAFGLLAVGCLVAAAGGGYLATRYNALPGSPADTSTRGAEQTNPGSAAALAARPVPAAPSLGPTDTPGAAAGSPTAAPRVDPRTETAAAEKPDATRPGRTPFAGKQAAASPGSRVDNLQAARPDLPPPQNPVQAPMPVAPALPVPVEQPAGSAPERQAPPLMPEKAYEQLVVASDSVLGLQLESTVSSDRARVEDRVEARVTRNVNVGDRVAIPAGSRLEGNVTLVERGGKMRERGRLGIRFHTLVLPDGGRTAITTEAVYREGESPAGRSAAKITGATAGGAILGALLGGRKGAAIGGAVGAAGGTAAVMAGSEQVVTLPAGTLLTVRLLSPVTVEVER